MDALEKTMNAPKKKIVTNNPFFKEILRLIASAEAEDARRLKESTLDSVLYYATLVEAANLFPAAIQAANWQELINLADLAKDLFGQEVVLKAASWEAVESLRPLLGSEAELWLRFRDAMKKADSLGQVAEEFRVLSLQASRLQAPGWRLLGERAEEARQRAISAQKERDRLAGRFYEEWAKRAREERRVGSSRLWFAYGE